jgi:hypothetical protein
LFGKHRRFLAAVVRPKIAGRILARTPLRVCAAAPQSRMDVQSIKAICHSPGRQPVDHIQVVLPTMLTAAVDAEINRLERQATASGGSVLAC